jgi:hypothetical protein
MNAAEGEDSQCVKRWMNRSLDGRLLALKNANSEQFSTEMNLQKEFNKSVESFETMYFEKCDGSICGMCSPAKRLNTMRGKQAQRINEGTLVLEKKSVSEAAFSLASLHFGAFAEGLCGMPSDVWKVKPPESTCRDLAVGEIAQTISIFFLSKDNETDGCAHLGLPPEDSAE